MYVLCLKLTNVISPLSRTPMASFGSLPNSIVHMDMDEGRNLLVTADADKTIRVSVSFDVM